MQKFLILSAFILISTKIAEDDFKILTDPLFYEVVYFYGSVYYGQKEIKNFHYRGKPKRIQEIRDNNKYKSYSSVYLDDAVDINEIKKFPKSTVFFISENNFYHDLITDFYDYYFVVSFYFNFDYTNSFYVIAGLNLEYDFKQYIILFLVLFSFILVFFVIFFCCYYNSSLFIKIYANKMAYRNLFLSLALAYSCIHFQQTCLISIFYSIYKTHMIIEIIYFLGGYQIIYSHEAKISKNSLIIVSVL